MKKIVNKKKAHYARYGGFYVQSLKRMISCIQDCVFFWKKETISTRQKKSYPIRMSIDQRCEQTINRDAKTTGGIKNFASKNQMFLNGAQIVQSKQKNTKALKDLCGISHRC